MINLLRGFFSISKIILSIFRVWFLPMYVSAVAAAVAALWPENESFI